MFMNLLDYTDNTIGYQRYLAAVSVCCLWIKVIDWLRLFDGTAFYIQLIMMTLSSIKEFLVIILVGYMMFGSAVYILEMQDELITVNLPYLGRLLPILGPPFYCKFLVSACK